MVRHSEYDGELFAEFYDILHAGLSDVDRYIEFAARHGPRILELGCGTGRVLIPLSVAGFRVTGVDASAEMLASCSRKLQYESPLVADRARLVGTDISQLDLGEEFDLVLAPCNFLNHFLTTEDALIMFERARAHLAPSGTLILDCSIPDIPHMVRTSGITQTFEFTHPLTGTTIRDSFTATYNFAEQREENHILLEEYSKASPGSVLLRREESRQTLTYYFPREARLLLRSAGFEIVREQGSLSEDVPISPDSGEMVFFCRKSAT